MSCLEIREITTGYGKIRVIENLSLKILSGKVTLLVGPNGSGKSTLAKAAVGILPVKKGSIWLNGSRIDGLSAEKIARIGVSYVPEDRHLFWDMTVRENLLMGGITLNKKQIEKALKRVYKLFPILEERSNQRVKTLSGGEQQMLAIARALVNEKTNVFILDEPCSGIAPKVIDKIFEVIMLLKQKEKAILLIDQNTEALEIADYVYFMRVGEIVAQGKPEDFISQSGIKEILLT